MWDLNGRKLFNFEGHEAAVYSICPHQKENIQVLLQIAQPHLVSNQLEWCNIDESYNCIYLLQNFIFMMKFSEELHEI